MLPSRSGRFWKSETTGVFLIVGIVGCVALAATPTPKPRKAEPTPKAASSLTNIPLPVGQEAKGLVLPDIDVQGHMRARFEAAVAKRTDNDHLAFQGLKMTTFTPENTTELMIEMPVSTLDLNSRVLSSSARTTVRRADFHIAGDRMSFDTVARKGTLVGNVKMVITDQTELRKKPSE